MIMEAEHGAPRSRVTLASRLRAGWRSAGTGRERWNARDENHRTQSSVTTRARWPVREALSVIGNHCPHTWLEMFRLNVLGAAVLLGCMYPGAIVAQISDGHPAWSPFEDRVAFERFEGGVSTILILDLESGALTHVGGLDGSNHHPSWSPDGRYVAYSSARMGNRDIYTWDLEQKVETRLTFDPAADETPAWSPDGHQLAFSSKREGGGLYLVELTTGDVTPIPLTALRGPATRPSWSPDGRMLAFHAGLGDEREIFTLDVEATLLLQLTDNASVDSAPSWSPDGTSIVFNTRRDGGRRELYSMEANGASVRRLTEHDADDADGSWSPSGECIVFYSDRSGAYRLWLLNPWTGTVRPVLDRSCQ